MLFKLLALAGILFTAYLVKQKGEDAEDSLFKLGNRLRTLEDDVQELKQTVQALNDKLDGAASQAAAPKAAARKAAPAKKASPAKKAAKKKAAKKS